MNSKETILSLLLPISVQKLIDTYRIQILYAGNPLIYIKFILAEPQSTRHFW